MPSEPTFHPADVAAVVFDIGGVFAYPQYRPVASGLASLDLPLPESNEAYRRAHHGAVAALSRAMVETGTKPDENDGGFWAVYDHAYLDSLGAPADAWEALSSAIRQGWDWLHEENIAAFHRLAADGRFPLAIVSNNNGTAPEQMREHGICQVGDGDLPSVVAIVDSALEGVAKPDPAIFAPALQALALDPATVLYVGDTVHADVHGARNAGMQVVQLDPYDDHDAYDHARVRDLDELVGLLGLG